MRSQGQFPEDPQTHFMDYVGNQRSPLWDEMDQMEDENSKLKDDIETLKNEMSSLNRKMEEAVRLTTIKECYDAADPDKTNAITMKPMVAKLSGFAKFELDYKVSKDQFAEMILKIVGEGDRFKQEKFDTTIDVL